MIRFFRDYVLCKSCEDRFSKGGEAYLGTLVARKDGFPLLDKLKVSLTHRVEKQHVEFSGSAVGLDTDKLAYFALSVLWRASVRKWRTLGTQTSSVVLGEYAEIFRRFLLGETAFPSYVGVVATVCTDRGSQGFLLSPGEVPDAGRDTQYSLLVRGIEFRVIVGIPASRLESVCCVHSLNEVLFLRNCHKEVQHSFDYLLAKAKTTGKMARRP